MPILPLLALLSTGPLAAPQPFASTHAEHMERFGDAPRRPRASREVAPLPGLPDITVYGYLPYWISDVTDEELEGLTHLAVFTVGLNSDGTLNSTSKWTDVAAGLVSRAHAIGVKVHLTVASFDDSTMEAVLASSSRRATAISELASLVSAYGADGVNVDFEGLPSGQKDNFVSFVQELAAAVDEVFLAMPAVDWSGSYDYDQLANASDGLFIMGYDYHWSGGDPGPVSPLYGSDMWGKYALDWTVEDYLTYGAPPSKLVLGLSLYGRWWPTSSSAVPGTATADGESVTMNEAIGYLETYGYNYEYNSRTPYTFYSSGQQWCDDVSSVQERVAWAVAQGLQGVGFWALGYEDEAEGFWAMMAEETREPATTDSGADTGDLAADTGDTGDSGLPVARAGESFLAYPGDRVILDGSASEDPAGGDLRFIWTQTAGPDVEIEKPSTANPEFVVEDPGTLTFELVVSNGTAYSNPDYVDVVVVDPGAGERYDKGGGCASAPVRPSWLAAAGLLLLALARRRR